MDRIALSFGLVLLTSAAVFAQDASPAAAASASAGSDSAFVSKAAVVGLAEVKLGDLAQKNGADADVKAYGKRMVDDHGKANQELTDLAAKKGWTLPKDVDADHQKMYDDLSKLSGAEFDKAYIGHMVSGHNGSIADFQAASTTAADADLKAWAGKTLPTLQEHLTQAQTVATKVGASAGASPAPSASGGAHAPAPAGGEPAAPAPETHK